MNKRSVLSLILSFVNFLYGCSETTQKSQDLSENTIASEESDFIPTPGAALGLTQSISQFGITWTFAQPARYGQFVNGDYWVLGPVSITSISPLSVMENGRTRNGSMINPTGGNMQGYDNTTGGPWVFPHTDFNGMPYPTLYSPTLNVARPNGMPISATNPLVLQSNVSLISSITNPTPGERPQLLTAAILTVLPEIPPEGSFRPSYFGTNKSIRYFYGQIQWNLMRNLSPGPNPLNIATAIQWFPRPWVDHGSGYVGSYINASQNQPEYYRDSNERINAAGLMVHMDYPIQQKRDLVVRLIQLGIDYYEMILATGNLNFFNGTSGHETGRKYPILFAGIFLNNQVLKNLSHQGALFGEDHMYFYVIPGIWNNGVGGYNETWANANAQWANPMGWIPEWTAGGSYTTEWLGSPTLHGNYYRRCCTSNTTAGWALSLRILGQAAMDLWNDDAFFRYMDRYMEVELSYSSPQSHERQTIPWVSQMWDTYRY